MHMGLLHFHFDLTSIMILLPIYWHSLTEKTQPSKRAIHKLNFTCCLQTHHVIFHVIFKKMIHLQGFFDKLLIFHVF